MKRVIHHSIQYLQSEGDGGFVMVLALTILLIVSLLGTLSLRVSNNEVLTSGNLEGSVASFYLLESIGQLGIEKLVQQNVQGDDCLEAIPERCLVKELHHADTTTLPWLDEAWSGDTSKDVFDLRVFDPTVKEDLSTLPKIAPFPDNWFGAGQRVSRVPEVFRVGSEYSLEPPGYLDREDGGDDLIRYALQDQGRIGVYSIGANDPVLREYRIYGLYFVGVGRSQGYPGKYGIELGYRLELATMEIM